MAGSGSAAGGDVGLRVGAYLPQHAELPASVAGDRHTGPLVVGGFALDQDGVVAGDEVADALAVAELSALSYTRPGQVERAVHDLGRQSGEEQFRVAVGFTDRFGVGIGSGLERQFPNTRTMWCFVPRRRRPPPNRSGTRAFASWDIGDRATQPMSEHLCRLVCATYNLRLVTSSPQAEPSHAAGDGPIEGGSRARLWAKPADF